MCPKSCNMCFQRRQRCSWRCLGTVRSAVRQRRRWDTQHRSSLWLLPKHWRQPRTPVWTRLFSRWFVKQAHTVCFCETLWLIFHTLWIFLQFKERDELARIFKLWIQPRPSSSSSTCAAPILMSKVWDYRVRQHLGTCYDYKKERFDWDLIMKLHEKGVFELFECFLIFVH